VHVEIGVPPPVAVVETAPPLRSGYVYAPGYWAWNGDRHVWVRGRTIIERPGYSWVADRWEPVSGRYRFVPGYWAPAKPGHGYAKGHAKGHGKGWAKGHNKD
jgi:YXWGXW repeat-containing protein